MIVCLSGCASKEIVRTGTEYCGIAKPIVFNTMQEIVDTTTNLKTQIYENNLNYKSFCGDK